MQSDRRHLLLVGSICSVTEVTHVRHEMMLKSPVFTITGWVSGEFFMLQCVIWLEILLADGAALK
jgi:hypothetical protein